jgi:hypothetical protein
MKDNDNVPIAKLWEPVKKIDIIPDIIKAV